MPTLLTLDAARSSDGVLVLSATGEIDLSNVDTFDGALTTAVAETAAGGGMLTVDLSGVEYLDSAAVNPPLPDSRLHRQRTGRADRRRTRATVI
jgi:anti-anti-sigma factor